MTKTTASNKQSWLLTLVLIGQKNIFKNRICVFGIGCWIQWARFCLFYPRSLLYYSFIVLWADFLGVSSNTFQWTPWFYLPKNTFYIFNSCLLLWCKTVFRHGNISLWIWCGHFCVCWIYPIFGGKMQWLAWRLYSPGGRFSQHDILWATISGFRMDKNPTCEQENCETKKQKFWTT